MSAPPSSRRAGRHTADSDPDDGAGGLDHVAMVRPYLSHPRPSEAQSAPVAPAPTDGQGPQVQDPEPEAAAATPDPAGARARPSRRRANRSGRGRGRVAAGWLSLVAAAGCLLWWLLPGAAPERPATVAGPPAADGATDSASAAQPTPTASVAPPAGPARSAPTTPAGRKAPATHSAPPTTASAVPSAGVPRTQEPPPAAAPSADAPARGRQRHSATAGSRELGPGDEGADVARLQDLLYDQGKTYVAATGVYDGDTERAVRDIQQEYGITGDRPGYYGHATRAALDPDGPN